MFYASCFYARQLVCPLTTDKYRADCVWQYYTSPNVLWIRSCRQNWQWADAAACALRRWQHFSASNGTVRLESVT